MLPGIDIYPATCRVQRDVGTAPRTLFDQGVENVYAQHVPLMMTTVEAALKGKLKDSAYPAVGPSGGKSQEVRGKLGNYWKR